MFSFVNKYSALFYVALIKSSLTYGIFGNSEWTPKCQELEDGTGSCMAEL